MGISQEWSQFPATYRETEARTVARWIRAGESGSVVGLTGVGRTTFLEFLCYRLDRLQEYLAPYPHPIHLIPVDLYNLPDNHLATFYRILLRSFYEQNDRFKSSIQQTIHELYRKVEAAQDPFLSQSALRELLTLFHDQEIRVVLVMNRFDRFCETATPQMTATLRGLRDGFKETLSYIMGMTQEIVYLTDMESIAPLRGILDTHICRIGPLSESDARHMIYRQTHYGADPIPEQAMQQLLQLSGGYPSLLRVLCHWWMNESQNVPVYAWGESLLARRNCQHRLRDIWQNLTEEEQFTLVELVQEPVKSGEKRGQPSKDERAAASVLQRLVRRGICRQEGEGWVVVGELITAYARQAVGQGRGRVWLDEQTGIIYQGRSRVDGLQPLVHTLLTFFLTRPHERHSHTELIEAVWPEDISKEGVSTEALYQVVRGARKAIESSTSKPRYLISWRGQIEGGYQFFPEGRPG
ncbi:MAG: winged helix-turn-helix domain-containing protein [Anaerolineae bacterium]|nr:winged helix-turn-helix domain-containing protein [Anaerolineae bacterium]